MIYLAKEDKILILGCGAIGGFISGKLCCSGYEPVVITHNKTITNSIKQNGLKIIEGNHEERIRIEVFTSLSELDLEPHSFDYIFLTMKATDLIPAIKEVSALLKEEGAFVTFQNGVVQDFVHDLISDTKIIVSVVVWGATMISPGIYKKTTVGKTVIGEFVSA